MEADANFPESALTDAAAAKPKARLPGSGGSAEIAAWANRCYIMTPHQKRRFPEKVDFQTSAGYCYGSRQRADAGVRGVPGPLRLGRERQVFERLLLLFRQLLDGGAAGEVSLGEDPVFLLLEGIEFIWR